MTVSYSAKVATSTFGCFLKLLFRWKGSIYRLLWKDFAVFAFLYYLLNFVYRFVLTGTAKWVFENISLYCETYNNLIPVAFVLGFYVSLVVNRFWEQFQALPWPYSMALFVSSLLQGNDTRGRLMRRTIMRYFSLAYVITLSSISPPVRKRFPTFKHMCDAGIMLPNELEVFEGMRTSYNTYFVPLIWAGSLITRARKEGRIKDDFAVKTLIDEINAYRGKCGALFNFDWVSVPLVYTQVVTLAVYMFFLSCLMGRQFIEEVDSSNRYSGDMYFPLFTFLQFFFYMGWLKVAESLLNPFGEDDDDFDINGLIDSNLQQTYLIVDGMHNEHPELIKDQYWDTFEIDLPYTHASMQHQKPEHVGSAVAIQVPTTSAQFVAGSMSRIPEEVSADDQEVNVEDGSRLDDEEEASGTARLLDVLLRDQRSNLNQDFAKSFGSQQNMLKSTKGKLSRQPSRSGVGSGWNLFSRSISHFSTRRGKPGGVDDVESGAVPQSPVSLLYPLNEDAAETKATTSFTSTQGKEDLQFEMSDDDQSEAPNRIDTISETDDSRARVNQSRTNTMSESDDPRGRRVNQASAYVVDESQATTNHSSPVAVRDKPRPDRLDLDSIQRDDTQQSQRENEFVDQVQEMLREMRDSPATVRPTGPEWSSAYST